jgi:hypothetical protein
MRELSVRQAVVAASAALRVAASAALRGATGRRERTRTKGGFMRRIVGHAGVAPLARSCSLPGARVVRRM